MIKKIYMFYGEECPYCHLMMPIADKLEKNMKGSVKFEKLEVWHNKKNLAIIRKFKKIIKKSCGGEVRLPTFFEKKKKVSFCGERSYGDLKKWVNSL